MTRIDVSRPQFDQNTYWGRAQHFFNTTNPMNLLKTSQQLDESREIVRRLRQGHDLDLPADQLWRHKQIYDSAFHPETGDKQLLIGRMSCQVPANMAITGCMLTFYRSNSAVVFWQWFNQSFNAVVNYTNRSGDSPVSMATLVTAYSMATSGALLTALSLNRVARSAPPLVGRFVPFLAVSAANCVNIPLMRFQELRDGLLVHDADGLPIGHSRAAARLAIAQVVFSRIAMAAPGMTIPPLLMDRLEKRGLLRRMPWISAPLQVVLCGVFLTFTTPLACAIFPQTASVALSRLEPELRLKSQSLDAFYNKGL